MKDRPRRMFKAKHVRADQFDRFVSRVKSKGNMTRRQAVAEAVVQVMEQVNRPAKG